jgi:molybdate transport system ATP-binding protein
MRGGEHWMIAGPNGAGKSTLLKLIYADHPQAYANEIHLFGRRVGSKPGESVWDIKARIGLVSAHLQARYRRRIRAHDVICSGFFDSVGLYRTLSRAQQETARRWAETLGIGAWVAHDFSRLSYGQRQLVLLARAMVKSPALLILDEPCDGLDGVNREKLLQLLEQIGSRTATNLLYVTHQAEEKPACITHTLRLDRGRVVGDAPTLPECAPSIPGGKGPPPARCRPVGR